MKVATLSMVDDSCDRLFLEEFEDLNNKAELSMGVDEDRKLSYSQEICGRKGFQRQRQLNVDKLMRMDKRKRQL